jgi:hypothetical protein
MATGRACEVGLLTAPLTIAREPLRLTLRAWEFGLSTAAEGARIGLELLDPDRDAAADFAWRSAPAPPGDDRRQEAEAAPPTATAAQARTATHAPPAPDAPPSVPDELIPDHVDEDPVRVAEAAEEGAEDGAGAELHVEPPWEGYDQMTAGAIRDRMAVAGATEAAAVELYETKHRNRRSVLDAAERALRA